MKSSINRYFKFTLLTVLSLIIYGCESSDQGIGDTSKGTGSVAVLLTDAPIDGFNKFLITVSEISLLGEDGTVSLFSGNETIDLLDLNSHSDLFSLTTNIPAGNYYKVRMQISDPKLLVLDMDGNILEDETVVPKMGGNGKLDLNPRGEIVITAGQTLALQLDMDAQKSIHLIQNGNGDYRFRPVVFIDVLTDTMLGKLVRLSGYVDAIEENSFELCEQPVDNNDDELVNVRDNDDDENHENEQEHCIKISTASSTSYFNDMGDAVDQSELTDNSVVTVLGYYSNMNDDRYVGFEAEVVELAAADVFKIVNGVIESIDTDNQLIEILDQNDMLKTIKFVSATRVFDMTGKSMLLEELEKGMTIKVEGIYDDLNVQVNAAVIFVEPASAMTSQLTGSFVSFHNDMLGFDMLDNTMGDTCVTTDENTNAYLLTIENDGFKSEAVSVAELQSGQHLDVYGSFDNSGCFMAESLLLEKL